MKLGSSGAIVVAWCLFCHINCLAQGQYQQVPSKTRILLLVDGSGSMMGNWQGTTRIGAAKSLLSDMVDSLRHNPDLELALRVYGHQFHRRLQNCRDTRLEVGFGKSNHDLIIQKLQGITPQGTTPMAYSLQQLEQDFPSASGYRNIVIIITDGLESCDGDPCAVSSSLQRKNIFLRPFIVGLGMNNSFNQQFSCLGKFFDAADIQAFRDVLDTTLKQTLGKTTVSVELLEQGGNPSVTDLTVSFINHTTGQSAYQFVHYLDARGKPDSVEVDPVTTYDIQVNTIPPVAKRNITFTGGQHNVVTVAAPQGTLALRQTNASEYGGQVQALLKKVGSSRIINIQPLNSTVQYLAGQYNVEILTLPRIFREVAIEAGQLTSVDLPAPGVLNISGNVPGVGSLFWVAPDGNQKWLLNLAGKVQRTMGIQPGSYKLVFRAQSAPGSKYTKIYDFTIKSGTTKTINLFEP